ncbi:acidic leucine-rich nuclear phosphoprotein 32 family member B-like [Papaver somniferum]|uniref:acidic leucine-rich nuclear phosphoprotein 32 family member B-like n=1 Tax=Papaver somniferum TaxID=3469 RepID=UPI000E6F563C|nr:acidic leucine-rich nuclear phosphoprotein 32 family member B-like [Papaver somniferum]
MDNIRKHIDLPLRVNGCMYWFTEHNNSMTPSNEKGFPRFLRWVISDISTTIEKYVNEAMKKMQPGWVKACSDEKQQIMDEYRKNRQENNRYALKEKLYKALQQRYEALEEVSDLQVKHEKLVSFIEEKSKKLYAADLRNVQDDKELVDLFVDSMQEIFSFNKELNREDERDDDEQEEEEGEKGEKSGKGGDVDDSYDDSDDDDDDDDDEEGDKGKRSGKGGDVDDSDEEQEEEDDGVKGRDEDEGGGKGGDVDDSDEEQKEEDGGVKGRDEDEGGGKGGDGEQDEEEDGGKGGDEEEGGGKGGDEELDEEEGGGKGGDLHDDDNGKEGSKGGYEEDRTES